MWQPIIKGPDSADQWNVFLATLYSEGVQLADINLGSRPPDNM